MDRGCTYFDLDSYAETPDGWTRWDWPAAVWDRIEHRSLETLGLREKGAVGGSGAVALDPESVLRERETTPRQLVDGDAGTTERDLVARWVAASGDVPDTCPHDPVDGADRCPFHLPPARTPVEEDALADRVTGGGTTEVVGGNFGVLDLRRSLLEADDNEAIRLDFCTVDRLLLDKAVLRQDFSMRHATVGEFTFERADFEGDFDVSRSRIHGEVAGSHATFHGRAYGVGAAIVGDDPVDLQEATFRRYTCFDEATFDSELLFWNGVFRADVEFRHAEFRGPVNARWVDFHRFPDFHGATFREDADFGGATFLDDAGFSEIEFHGETHFQSEYNSFNEYAAVFHGVADFTRSTFHRQFNLRETEFKKYASFRHVEVEGETVLWNAEFDEDADFFEARFADDVDFRWVTFNGYGDFNDVDFRGTTDFGGVSFRDDVGFSDAVFRDDVLFRGEFSGYEEYKSEFGGVADFGGATFGGTLDLNAVFDDDVSFANAHFEGDVEMVARFAGVADFSSARFGGDVDFHDTEFRTRAVFSAVEAARPVDMSNVVFRSGLVSQPAESNTYYDFYRATVGDVDLAPTDDADLFDYFRFCETTFDGFDFPHHGEALIGNWRIHEFDGRDDEISLSELINTYLKAKNGASAVGAKSASAEFFIREMQFRRKKHWAEATGGPLVGRVLSFGKWVSNWFLNVSCGYGERPLRTVNLSVVLILVFAALYQVIGLQSDGSVLTYLLFSTQAFVTLIFGQTPAVNSLAVQFAAAVQGFVGAFFIALFVFALTRSIHR